MASSSSWKSGPSPPVPRPRGLSAGSSNPKEKSRGQGSKEPRSHYHETVVSMLSMLSCSDQANAQQALLAMTNSPESCQALRKAGCIPLLIQILHPPNLPQVVQPNPETKSRAARALKNIVQLNADEKVKWKEVRILKLLESIRSYTEHLKARGRDTNDSEDHPVRSSLILMKGSFDQEDRNTMCLLGAIHSLADLIQTDHAYHGNQNPDCILMRRYSGMTLTNLTYGYGTNKALLCSMKEFMTALVAQLESPNEDVRQVTASVLRNLSWTPDGSSRSALRESNAVTHLITAAINSSKESMLMAALFALLNLSSHCAANKTSICQTPQAIEFLIGLLNSKTLSIIENAGGILRNASTVVDDELLRQEFRVCGIFEILLEHLKSSSLIVVSNACGMLWHLSTNSEEDQRKLIDLGAIPKLKALMYSKHERIAQGAGSALRNLLNYSSNVAQPTPAPRSIQDTPQQQPIDLRTSSTEESSENPSKTPKSLQFSDSDEPLDLSLHSTKSTPIHVISASEFGSHRQLKNPAFLNPLLSKSSTQKYDSPKNYNSCPEFMRFVQPTHTRPYPAGTSAPIDFSQGEATADVEDTTTDYSLHFTESEDLPTTKNEDTVKTYCCEGTPLNFSTSNSMSDLTQVEKPTKLKPISESGSNNVEDQTRKYCTEHTPASFSRASSLSSIASNIQGGENTAEYLDEAPPKMVNVNGSGKEKVKRNVTFSANETPLMFSRASSVNSLDSVDINYEDTGSVASEFSRRASEVVSPSELPDSPRQIGPAYPLSFEKKGSVQEQEAPNRDEDMVKVFAKGESAAASGLQSVRSLSPLTIDGETVGVHIKMDWPESKLGVGGQDVAHKNETPSASEKTDETYEPKVFEGIEGTPFGISTATSLSDLMSELDIDEKPEIDPVPAIPEESAPTSSTNNTDSTSRPLDAQQEEPEPIYSDDQMLAKCIRAGRAARIPKSKSEFSKLNTKSMKMSASYHEELKKDTEIDPDLAALIQMGKNRVRGNRGISVLPPKHQPRVPEPRDLPKNIIANKVKRPPMPIPTADIPEKADSGTEKSPKREPQLPLNQQSIISMGSEWNEDSCSLSIPSLSINTAFRMAESTSTRGDTSKTGSKEDANLNDVMLQSTLSTVEPPSGFSALVSSTGCWLPARGSKPTSEESNIFNQKPPPELLDMENSMISVASLKSEVASITGIEDGMNDMSLGGETYTIGGGSDATDAEESINEDNSMSEVREMIPRETVVSNQERFLTFTAKRHTASPRQKRKDDPGRYLTRTISPHSPHDTNRNHSPSPTRFSTFKVDRSPKVNRPLAATSNDSSPASSPRGIRGRRKPLYASLPPQPRKSGPPIPPKPKGVNNSIFVRPTRTSELRAAGSRDISPKQSKNSSKNSSTSSLNSMPLPYQTRRTPPKPPIRTSASTKSFAVVRTVRNSNSSIGFTEERGNEIGFNTLPRPFRVSETPKETHQSKVGKLSNFWNQLTSKATKTDNSGAELNGNNVKEKKSKFGFHSFGIGKKKKDNVSLKSDDYGPCHVNPQVNNAAKGKATVAPFNYNNTNNTASVTLTKPESNSGSSKMTTV